MTETISQGATGVETLPEGWGPTTLSEICAKVEKVNPKDDPGRDFQYLDIAAIDNATQKIVQPKNYTGADAPSRARQLVQAGDVLFSTVRTYLRNIAQVSQQHDGQIASTGFTIVRPMPGVEAGFLFHLVQTNDFLEPLNAKQRGTSYPAVRDSDVFAQPVDLPPLNEQRRIVEKIEELFTKLDAGVRSLEQAREQLKSYRRSVLKAAVEGELSREWREAHRNELEPASELLDRILQERREKFAGKKYKEPASPDTSKLSMLPDGWTWAALPQLGELNRGKSKHRPRNAPFLYGGPYPFIQTGDIRESKGTIRGYRQSYTEEGLKQSRLWPRRTLCITIAANIAETGILGFEACFPDSVVGFLAKPEHCNVAFVEYFMRTARERLDRYAPATAQKNINLQTFNGLAVPLPSLEEQRFIVGELERRLSVVDKLEATVEENLKQAAGLRQSILKRAFSGELVPQDPDDEPASVLLARIKEERQHKHHGSVEPDENTDGPGTLF